MKRLLGFMARKLYSRWIDVRELPAYVAAWPVVSMPLRMRILAWRGHRFAPLSRILPGTIVFGTRLDLGRDTFINRGCRIDATDSVRIGDNVHLSPGVRIETFTHNLGPSHRRAYDYFTRPVVIGHGCWVGTGVTILPGVTVGCGAVLAAGCLVHRDVPADVMVGGVPAAVLRQL